MDSADLMSALATLRERNADAARRTVSSTTEEKGVSLMTVIAPEPPQIVEPQVTLLHARSELVGRQELRGLPVPEATRTHVPIPHADVVEALIQSLGYRNIEVVKDEYALTLDLCGCSGS